MIQSISKEELKQLMADTKSIQVLDVRSEEEYLLKHIPFAINISLPSIENGAFLPEPNAILITACGRGGGRARKAAAYLQENCTNKVFTLDGGSLGWLDGEEE
ncbi:MAG: rhodanese-like domain-containing protein [Bacteroidia bacterium]|nr:rhodanese-like domain-containing protein [Bacteroidia bacterium]MCF8427985.1 rhodanese-like domain-containing protein [Bacteroidia bacterium]